MNSRHEVVSRILPPRIIKAFETVFGSKMKLVVPERPEISPWTIIGKGVVVDFHPLPNGVNTWMNVTSLDGHPIIDLIPSAIITEPNVNLQKVTVIGQKGTIMIIPKDGEVVFKKPEVGI